MNTSFDGRIVAIGYGEHAYLATSVMIGKPGMCHFVDNLARDCNIEPFVRNGFLRLKNRCQRSFLDWTLDGMVNASAWLYYSGYNMYTEYLALQDGREAYAQIKHVKKRIRQQYVNGVLLHVPEDVMVDKMGGNVKKEYAKPGKVPRLFVSYGKGCMYSNEIPEFIKLAIDGQHYFRRGTLHDECDVTIDIMAKPKSISMQQAFAGLMDATRIKNTIYVAIYSDDAVYGGNWNGEAFLMNVDISGCDASNGAFIFGYLCELMAQINPERARGLVEQCMKPLEVRNPDNTDEKFVFNIHGPFEGSGTVLTTCLNHVASYNDAIGFCRSFGPKPVGVEMQEHAAISVNEGARRMGHKVTCEPCGSIDVVYEKMQLLKFSLFRTTKGSWCAARNYACFFRALGSVEGDMRADQLGITPAEFATWPWTDRMEVFCGAVIQGLINEPQSRIMNALRKRFPWNGRTVISLSYEGEVMSGFVEPTQPGIEECFSGDLRRELVLDEQSLCLRYGITEKDIDELVESISQIQLGRVSTTFAVTRFNAVDYGLE
jgi:hypothetical protein